MPRVRKVKEKPYKMDSLMSAVKSVKKDGLRLSQAAKDYSVPRKTLSDYVKMSRIENGEVICQRKQLGHQSAVFTKEQEGLLVERLLLLNSRGFPMTVHELKETAYAYAIALIRKGSKTCIPKAWEKNNLAGEDWYLSFRKRNPELSLRKPEGLSTNRAQAFNKERVDSYFEIVTALLKDVDPRLILNIDETGLSSVPNTPQRVLSLKGVRTVSSIQVGERGTLTTVIPCVNAAGDLLPPFVIFKGIRMDSVLKAALDDAGIEAHMTESGYIDKHVFLQYLKFVNEKRPSRTEKCYIVMDGHFSHHSYEALSYCLENNMELICIPPHTSHRLQPLDTHWNGPLKKLWSQLVQKRIKEKQIVSINRFDFIKLLKHAWQDMSEKRELITKGFQHCGLFPPNNVVKEEEYNKTIPFLPEQKDLPETRSQQSSAVIKNVLPSPIKLASQAHKRAHVTMVCSPENVEAKKMKAMAIKSKVKSLTTKGGTKLQNTGPTKIKMPTWMNSSPSTSSATQATAKTAKNPNNKCHICFQPYGSNKMLDFFKCVLCQKWTCEDCFEIERCTNCI